MAAARLVPSTHARVLLSSSPGSTGAARLQLGAGVGRLGPVEDRLDPGELGGLAQVVVEAGLAGGGDVAGRAVAGERDQDDVVEVLLGADLAGDLEAAAHGQADVDQGGVGVLALDQRD